jgi:hypothetical protein
MSAWIRKSPFTTIDPKREMIRLVSEQANLTGTPLSEFELAFLSSANPQVDETTERRLRDLVVGVIDNQRSSGQDRDPKSFVNAIEWAGDGEWPYVVAIAVAQITGNQDVEQVDRRTYSGAWIIAGCFGFALLILLARRL